MPARSTATLRLSAMTGTPPAPPKLYANDQTCQQVGQSGRALSLCMYVAVSTYPFAHKGTPAGLRLTMKRLSPKPTLVRVVAGLVAMEIVSLRKLPTV